jgi:hypothetical protein
MPKSDIRQSYSDTPRPCYYFRVDPVNGLTLELTDEFSVRECVEKTSVALRQFTTGEVAKALKGQDGKASKT